MGTEVVGMGYARSVIMIAAIILAESMDSWSQYSKDLVVNSPLVRLVLDTATDSSNNSDLKADNGHECSCEHVDKII